MQCSSRCYHRRHGAGSFRRESGSGSRSALAPKSTTPPGPVLGQRTRREAGWRWGVMVDLGPLGPPWTSSKLMFAQQMPIPQVRPGRAHLGRYPGRRGSTPLPWSAAVRDLAGRKTRSRRNGAYSSFRCSSKMKMSASGQVEMSAFGDAASPERRIGGPGAGRDEQQGAGPSRRRPASRRGPAHAGEGRGVHRPLGTPSASAVRGLRGARAGRLASDKRGQPSNRRLPGELGSQAIEIVRERYVDFGPTLACEKLLELHDLQVSRETLRAWLIGAGIWIPRRERVRTAHQPRHRRECLGELVQIDGCEHAWFEDRGPGCTLLVYVDDATGRLLTVAERLSDIQ